MGDISVLGPVNCCFFFKDSAVYQIGFVQKPQMHIQWENKGEGRKETDTNEEWKVFQRDGMHSAVTLLRGMRCTACFRIHLDLLVWNCTCCGWVQKWEGEKERKKKKREEKEKWKEKKDKRQKELHFAKSSWTFLIASVCYWGFSFATGQPGYYCI